MTTITIKGNTCQITEEEDINHILALDKALSFYVVGAEHTAAFRGFFNKQGDFVKWDGYKKLLTPTLQFSIGLLERVKDFYQEHHKPYTLVDRRPPKSIGQPIDILPKLQSLNKPPYPYQANIVPIIEQQERGIIKVATGGGKTLIAALIVAKLGKKSIIYVIGKDLLYQFHAFFSEVFDEPIGIVGDGKCEIHNINIVSIWTAAKALGLKKDIFTDPDLGGDEEELATNKYSDLLQLIKTTKVIQIDECHMSACDTIQEIFKHSKPEHIYGLSGSPWRDDNQDLLSEAILGRKIVDIPASYLIQNGFLAQPYIIFRAVPPYPYDLEKQYQSIYKKYIVENDVRNGLILEATKSLVNKGYQSLVLFTSLKHGKILKQLFEQHNLNYAILDGSNSQEERNEIKQKLLNKELDCLLASKIFDIGVDIPSLSGLVLASGGKSSVKALQRVGRVIRKSPGKKQAVIIDFIDQATFLLEHSKTRYRTYSLEEGFDITWPGKKPRKKKLPAET